MERATESSREAVGAAARSEQRAVPEGATVTYQDVLKNPDDPRVNAAYARAQIKAGDLLGASTTLERIVLTHPEAADAQLLYGFVLYRLDDAVTARTVLTAIDPTRLAPAQRTEREQLLTQIDSRSRSLHQSFTLSLGGHHDSNRNAAPDDGNVLVADTPGALQGEARVRKDWGYIVQGIYDADYDLGTDPKTSVFTTLNLMRDKQMDVGNYNTVSGGAEIGLRRQDGPWRWQAGVFITQMTLYGDYFLNDYGIEFKPVRKLDANWEAFGEFRVERQAFHDIVADPTGNENSGYTPTLSGCEKALAW